MNILTAPDLAAKLKVSPQTITRNATRYGIGRKVGRQWLFIPSEVKQMADLLEKNTQRDFSAMGKKGMTRRWS